MIMKHLAKPRAFARRGNIALAIALAGASILSGCSGPSGQVGVEDLAAKNQAQWVMPMDEFAVASPELGNYAEQLLVGKCLRGKGYEWDVPWQNTDFKWPDNYNEIGIKIFNVDTAKKWGYRIGSAADPDSSAKWTAFVQFADSYSPDSSFQGKFASCLQDVRDPDTMRDADQRDYVLGLKRQALEVADTQPAVREALASWTRCLLEEHNLVAAPSPDQMPTEAISASFSSKGSSTGAPSSEEIAAAVADATCRESSGYSAARYAAEWDAEVDLVSQNREKLDRIRDEAVVHRDELLTVVAENAPKAK